MNKVYLISKFECNVFSEDDFFLCISTVRKKRKEIRVKYTILYTHQRVKKVESNKSEERVMTEKEKFFAQNIMKEHKKVIECNGIY